MIGKFYIPRNSGALKIPHTLNRLCFNNRPGKDANGIFGTSGNIENGREGWTAAQAFKVFMHCTLDFHY